MPPSSSVARCAIAGLLALLPGCSEESDPDPDLGYPIGVTVVGAGIGSGGVVDDGSVAQFEFPVDCHLNDSTATGDCHGSFRDAGGGGSFSVIASASAGSTFGGWVSGCTRTVGALNQTCVMQFAPGASAGFTVRAKFNLAAEDTTVIIVQGAGSGRGLVRSFTPNPRYPIECSVQAGSASGACQLTMITSEAARTYALDDEPASGHVFGGWTGCSQLRNGDCELAVADGVNRTFTVTARFDPPAAPTDTIIVSVHGAGTGSGTVTDDGATAPADGFSLACAIQAGAPVGKCVDTLVTLESAGTLVAQAAAASGSTFAGWTGCASVTGSSCNMTYTPGANASFDATVRFDPAPAGTELIAFASDRDGNVEIYTMLPDGTQQTRVTNDPGIDTEPSWAPDGVRLVFDSDRDGDREIFIVTADGTGILKLTDNSFDDDEPAWSPDGKKIAFESDRTGNVEIHTMTPDGQGVLRITTAPTSDETDPTWSPDNLKILLVSDQDGDEEIVVVDAAGGSLARYTINGFIDSEPSWSPDGKTVLFQSDRDGNPEIYALDIGLNSVTRLTNNPAEDGRPVWSPDGMKIAFASARDGNLEIYVMNKDGTNQTRITNNTAADDHPSWGKRP